MSARRRILAVSTSRGDTRALRPVVDALQAGSEVRVLLADVAEPFWTGREVTVADTGLAGGDDPSRLVRGGHRLACAMLEMVEARRPAMVLLHGDRHELLALAHSALLLRIPIVHLGGGDLTLGAFDDSVRHALTKLAHLHLCTTEEAADRVRRLGEESWRVLVVGEPALDGLVEASRGAGDVEDVERALGFRLERPAGLLTYHPPTAAPSRLRGELSAILEASASLSTIVATYPAAEPGAEEIIGALHATEARREGFHVIPHLGDLYPALLALVDVVLGNSSSGVIEAATFGAPCVDVGDRQSGRLRPRNVIHAEGRKASVANAVARALDPALRASLRGMANPYGDGHAGARAAAAILDVPLDHLLLKRFEVARR